MVYSWMKPRYVEAEYEYLISKMLLMQFISSGPVLMAAEGKLFIIVRILKWLRGYVYAHESLYLYYLRKTTRIFFTAHSSAHEVSANIYHFKSTLSFHETESYLFTLLLIGDKQRHQGA